MNDFKIENVIFCESIRIEVGGKYTLLGASAPELSVPAAAIPTAISGSIFVTGIPQKSGPFSVEIRVNSPDKNSIIRGKLEGDFIGESLTSLAIGPMPLQITKFGDYTFEWKFEGKKWIKLEKLIIRPTAEPPISSLASSV